MKQFDVEPSKRFPARSREFTSFADKTIFRNLGRISIVVIERGLLSPLPLHKRV
jgi:hypothetical protein